MISDVSTDNSTNNVLVPSGGLPVTNVCWIPSFPSPLFMVFAMANSDRANNY